LWPGRREGGIEVEGERKKERGGEKVQGQDILFKVMLPMTSLFQLTPLVMSLFSCELINTFMT
jgi:hypothetical protein